MSELATGGQRRVLVTDDDPSILRLVAAVLRRADLEVDTATNGREAMEKIDRVHYDVVVLDLMMPEVTGFEVIARLTARPDKPKFVVLMSATSPDILANAGLSVFAALRKPFEISEMIKTVRACIASGDEQTRASVSV